MTSSTFYRKPNYLNENYQLLKNQPRALQFYFEKCFALMDENLSMEGILSQLLREYCDLPVIKNSERAVEQHALAGAMQVALTTSLQNVFTLLNQTYLQPEDDLTWLLSAYCSIFPFVNRYINPDMQQTLKICDVDKMYLESVLYKFLKRSDAQNVLRIDSETVDIAFLTNQYEWFLMKKIAQLPDLLERSEIFGNMHVLLKHANEEQVDLVLERILPLLEHSCSSLNQLLHAMPAIIAKASPETLEEKIIPKLLNRFNEIFVDSLLLLCIEKLDPDALRRSLKSTLTTHVLQEEMEEKSVNHPRRKQALKPFLAMMGKLSKEENDVVSAKVVKLFDGQQALEESTLVFLKKLRAENYYVDAALFQHLANIIHQRNKLFLQGLRPMGYPSHMTAKHVERFCKQFLAGGLEDYRVLQMLIELAAVSTNEYPMSLRKSSMQFLIANRDDPKILHETWLKAFTAHVKTHDFSVGDSRKILLEYCDYAFQNMQTTPNLYKFYGDLLKACVSHMTEEEINVHVVAKLSREAMGKQDITYREAMTEVLKEVFDRVENEVVYNQLFQAFLKGYFKDSQYKDVLGLLVNKVSPVTQIYACRDLLKAPISPFELNKVACVLTLFYQRDRKLYHDIPQFGYEKAFQSQAPAKSNCVMM